ncbi:flippase, partial [Bacteroides sp. AF25-18]
IAAPMSMGLVIMAPTLVYLFCGEGYVPSISTMQITAPIILFISISYVLVQSIFSLGKENITIITGIVGALTNVAINFMLIPHWAQDGAAIGTLLAEFSVMIAYLFIIRRFSIISIFTRHTALCLFAVAIMGTCLWGVSLWKFSHTLNLFVMPLVGGAVYATVLGFAKEPLLLDVCRMVKQRIRIK